MAINKNTKYMPSFMRAARLDTRSVTMTLADKRLQDTSAGDDNSFKYDPLDFPLKSTQQLNVDWSDFSTHTFFSSAEVKVNEAFNNIVNGFPFDGTKKEVEDFYNKLTGFEKWVIDSFPQRSGALHFSGSWISVKDKSGFLFPELAKNSRGETIINPEPEDDFSVELLLKLPTIVNDKQVIFQKLSGSSGITLYLSSSASTTDVVAKFCISSGSFRNSVSASLPKGSYNHLCVVLERADLADRLQFYVNERLVGEGQNLISFGKLDIDNSDLVIGSGSSFYDTSTYVTPVETLSGTLDEFRVFHSTRDTQLQKYYATKGLYSSSDLKLYYRFNEPPPPLSTSATDVVNSIVLDSSGNSLHAYVSNFTGSLRINAATDLGNPMSNERPEFKLVLFPAHPEILSLNNDLLTSASLYDAANPNIITRLVPPHYFLEGAADEGHETPEGLAGEPYGGSGIPGQGEWGSSQVILSFLYIWAKFFDEIKLHIDSFGTLKSVDYDLKDTMPDNFLDAAIRAEGLYLPGFFTHSSVSQYADNEGVASDVSIEENSLKKIQALLTRRVLINLKDVVRSKGTHQSIRTFLRTVGIDPDNSLKIREYGGPTTKMLTSSREKKMEPGAMVDFLTSSLIVTAPLSASRIEPGWPSPAGAYVYGDDGFAVGTTAEGDGLLTSGSWTIEQLVKFPSQKTTNLSIDTPQSIFRLFISGSSSPEVGLVANVVATPGDHDNRPRLDAYLRPSDSPTAPVCHMTLNMKGTGIFDGEKWNISLGCVRNDEIASEVSSSYYLRAGRAEWGELTETYTTSSYLHETSTGGINVLRGGTMPLSGTHVATGKNQTISTGISFPFLNNTLAVDSVARTTTFSGWASNFRFWSRSVSEDEWREHVRNYRSTGADDPYVGYNFVDRMSGSFGRLRVDSMKKQEEKYPGAGGDIILLDFSQNDLHMTGSGFVSGSRVLIGDVFSYGLLSPHFDEASTDDKVRIRSFEDPEMLVDSPWATIAPSYLYQSVFQEEEPQDDVRMSIEFSLVDALDRDIINMFSTFDALGDAIGDPNLIFSPDYPNLDVLRDVYFNRLRDKMNFRKFLEFYRWFDVSISTFIEQLLPSKTRYKGTNFVIESHVLERHKNEYRHFENYLGDRRTIADSLLLQQLTAVLKKY